MASTTTYARTNRTDRDFSKDRGFENAGRDTASKIQDEINDGSICEDFSIPSGFLGLGSKEVFRYDDIINQNQEGLSRLSHTCLVSFTDRYITFKDTRESANPENECLDQECPFFESMSAYYQSNLIFLRQQIAQKAPETIQRECLSLSQAQANPVQDNEETLAQPMSILAWYEAYGDTLDEVDQVDESPSNRWCSEFNIGESRIVNKSAYGSPSGVEMRYALTRDSQNQYSADIVIDFSNNGDSRYSDQQILERVKNCAQLVSSQFETDSGERLRINVHSPEEAQRLPESRRAPPIEITYGTDPDAAQSGHSRNYPDGFQCGDYTHELLHLMGLADEYDPTHKDTIIAGCRPVSKTNTIMSAHSITALNELGFDSSNLPEAIYNFDNSRRMRSCTCEDSNQTCRAITQKNNSNLNLYNWGKISPEFARRNGYNCQEVPAVNSNPVEVTRNSTIPTPGITPFEGGVFFMTYEFQESSSVNQIGSLTQKMFRCDCTTQACRNREVSVIEATDFYWIPINRCPDGTRDMMSEWIRRPASSDRSFSDGIVTTDEQPFSFNLQAVRGFDGFRDYHFNRIKHGNCATTSVTYSRCARVGGFDNSPTCSETPPECRVSDVLLTDD